MKNEKELDEITTLKLQKFISESERITTEAKELNSKLTLEIIKPSLVTSRQDELRCSIKFNDITGSPFLDLREKTGFSSEHIQLQLNEVRLLLKWLKDRGIE